MAGYCSAGRSGQRRMSHRNLVLTVAGVALAIGLAVGLMLNGTNAVEQTPAQFPAISLHQASIFLRHHGQKQAELHSERVEVSRDLRYATFTGKPTAVEGEAGREVYASEAAGSCWAGRPTT